MKYNRILLKLSGESLMGEQSYGINSKESTDKVGSGKKSVRKLSNK